MTHGDPELLARARSGDSKALDRLFALNRDAIRTLARRVTGDDEIAGDVANDLRLDWPRRVGTYKGESEFGTWLYQVVRNAALSALRHRRRVADRERSLAALGPGEPAAPPDESTLLRREIIARLRLPRDREVAELRRQGYRYREIAARIGSTETAVRTRFHRIRIRLQKAVEPR